MAARRYWRLNVRTPYAFDGYTQIPEVELRIAPGGADQTAPGGAVTLTGALQSGSAAATVANDNSASWAQWGLNGGVTWTYDFGAGVTKDIVEVAICGSIGNPQRSPGEFDVQSSADGITFETEWTVKATAYTQDVYQVFTKPNAALTQWRYVRLRAFQRFFDGAGSSALTVAKLEVAETVGGADVAAGGTASAYSTYGGTSPANVLDNDPATVLASNTSQQDTEWLMVDLGVNRTIKQVRCWARNDIYWEQFPHKGVLEVSLDAKNFLPWVPFKNGRLGGSGGPIDFIRPVDIPSEGAGKRRMWGIRMTASAHATAVGLGELELRAVVGGPSICTGGRGGTDYPQVTATQGDPKWAFDGNPSNEFACRSKPAIIMYDFGVGNGKVRPAQLKITARGPFADNFTQAPTAFDLVCSDDGINFETVESFTSPSPWSSQEQRTFGVTPPPSLRRRVAVN